MTVPETCSTREVAQRLGLAVRSVQMMVDRGELEAWKTPGGHRRISRQSVDRWLVGRGLSPLQGAAHGAAALAAPVAAGLSPAQQTPPHPMRRASDRMVLQPRLVPSTPEPAVQPSAATTAPAVLLIEDSVHYQNLITLLMRQHFPGLQLHVAGDGIAGLAMAGQLRPRVLLVDILLPGIDGSTLINGLRSHAPFDGTQLIVVTSLDDSQREPYAQALAGLPVVHKPRLVPDLPPLLRQMLGVRSAPAESDRSAAR